MLVTNHVLSGAVVGRVVRNVPAAFGVGVLSHLVLDAVPHWGGRPIEEVMGVAVADGLTGLAAMALRDAGHRAGPPAAVLAGMAGAAFLDLDKPSSVFFGFSPFPAAGGRVPRPHPARVAAPDAAGAAGRAHRRAARGRADPAGPRPLLTDSAHERPASRPGARGPRRRLRGRQVELGAAALPRRGGRRLGRPARGGRQRPPRPGRVGRRLRAARPDRRRPGAARAHHRGGHARAGRRTPSAAAATSPGSTGCPPSWSPSTHPPRCAGAATPSATARSRPGCSPTSCGRSGAWPTSSTTRAGTTSSGSPTSTRPRRPSATPAAQASRPARRETGLDVVLQVSRFPWGEDPAAWLTGIARAAEEAGFAGLALMDHLIQIPQVGSAWEQIPEPWVTLGLLAGPRHPAAARHARHAGDVPAARDHRQGRRHARRAVRRAGVLRGRGRLVGARAPRVRAAVPAGRRAARRRWRRRSRRCGRCGPPAPRRTPASGCRCPRPPATPARCTTCRSSSGAPAARRTLRIAARLGDGCNVPVDAVEESAAVLRRHCEEVGRDPAEVAVTVLDLPVVGRDRDDVWARVERLRGRTGAAAYAAPAPRRHPGPAPGALPAAGRAGRVDGVLRAAGADRTRRPRRGPRDAALTEGAEHRRW